MKHSVLFLLTAITYVATSAHSKDKNPANYPLIVHVLGSSRETQLIYRGTDCTSSAYGEIDEIDTLTARIYTTCSPNWAAYRYAFAELDLTNTDPTVNNTVRFLGQCANASGAARASRILGSLGNAMAAAGGTPEQQTQAEQRSRGAQPIPPSSKCDLAPGDYSGRWEKGKLELLLVQSNGRNATVSFIATAVTVKQNSTSAQPTASLPQDCPQDMIRVATSYGSYCDARAQTTKQHASQTSAQPESTSMMSAEIPAAQGSGDATASNAVVSPPFTHDRFTENGKTFSQDGTHVVTDCMMKPVDDGIAAGFCGGYVEAIADLLSDSSICIPPQVSGQQLVTLVLQYAAKHEDMLHGPASGIVSDALREAYACRSATQQH